MPRFFDILGRSKGAPEEKVNLSDLEEWLRRRIDAEFKEVCREGEDILRHLEAARSAVKEAAEDFSKSEIRTGELNQPLIPLIRSSKESIAGKALNTVGKIEIPRVQGFESLVETNRNALQALAQMDQTLRTHGRVVYATLDKEIRPLLSQLKQMQREVASLSRLVEQHNEKAAQGRKIADDAAQLSKMGSEISTARSIVEDAEKGEVKAEESAKGVKSSLEEIVRSKDYATSKQAAEDEKQLSLDLKKMEADFDTAFSKLRKPLEKYGYSVKLDKCRSRLLMLYVDTPSIALVEDSDLVLEGFLAEMKTLISSGKVAVKTPDKIMQRIDELLPELKKRREKIVRTKEELSRLRESLKDSLLRKAENLQSTLEEKQHSKEEQKMLMEKKRNEISETSKRMDNLAAKIETEIEEAFKVKMKIQRAVS
ncbi:MAG: hypothetical protein M1503_01075 [Thaumarchaeota archaeon]|nr:hypothetical protein [Nitrososphaerota archaeon]MCL5316847.1 hypothetical protein [Nitrososphaerota archaeon]